MYKKGRECTGHPIARQLEKWWGAHYEKPQDEHWLRWIGIYTRLLSDKMKEFSTEHDNSVDGQKLFGMSKAGGCTRASGLKYIGEKESPRSGSDNFTFFIGHSLEIAVLSALIAIGYNVETQVDVLLKGVDGTPTNASKADGLTKITGIPTLISVKSAAYKMSGRQNGWKWVRRGFAELPFQGVYNTNPSWVAQSQLEMLASGVPQTLYLVGSKDIVKAFKDDEYLGDNGNGSLAFYAEIIKFDQDLAEKLAVIQEKQLKLARSGNPGPSYYLTNKYEVVELVKGSTGKGWGGPNKELTGTFNPCFGCDWVEACLKHE